LFARGQYDPPRQDIQPVNGISDIATRGIKVFSFIAGLVLLGEAYAAVAKAYLEELSKPALFWANVAAAALDNATVVAIEIRGMPLNLAREAIVSCSLRAGCWSRATSRT
jgi:predicted cation transporter